MYVIETFDDRMLVNDLEMLILSHGVKVSIHNKILVDSKA